MADEFEQDTMESLAIRDLTTAVLSSKSGAEDNAMLGNALLLLSSRSCSVACGPVGRQPRSIRERGFGPID
jgi:hypothetical protein